MQQHDDYNFSAFCLVNEVKEQTFWLLINAKAVSSLFANDSAKANLVIYRLSRMTRAGVLLKNFG